MVGGTRPPAPEIFNASRVISRYRFIDARRRTSRYMSDSRWVLAHRPELFVDSEVFVDSDFANRVSGAGVMCTGSAVSLLLTTKKTGCYHLRGCVVGKWCALRDLWSLSFRLSVLIIPFNGAVSGQRSCHVTPTSSTQHIIRHYYFRNGWRGHNFREGSASADKVIFSDHACR